MQLSDGLCSSACALFLELMHHQAGVRTVVVGGQPSYGPMQAPAGNRGARSYTAGNLDEDFKLTKNIDATTEISLPAREPGIWIRYASLNLRDQIREDQNAIPLQFVYEAADCRIFYTKDTYNNFTSLWSYAAEAIWTDPSKCVKGSTGFARYGSDTDIIGPPQPPPSTKTDRPIPGVVPSSVSPNPIPVLPNGGLRDSGTAYNYIGHICTIPDPNYPNHRICPHNYNCVRAKVCDIHDGPNKGKIVTQHQCWPKCSNISDGCGNPSPGPCHITTQAANQPGVWLGTCPPKLPVPPDVCAAKSDMPPQDQDYHPPTY